MVRAMDEQSRFQVERRVNPTLTVEAGNGPGRWAEGESQDALARLDARLNPDHGSAVPASGVDADPLEHRALIAFSERSERSERSDATVATDEAATRLAAVNAYFEGADSAVEELRGDVTQAWGDIQPTP